MKSYYLQLRPIAESKLKAYRRDFFRHDKKRLRGSKPKDSFLWGIRESGTNIVSLDQELDSEQIECSKIWNIGHNEEFYHCNQGKIKKVTRDRAKELIESMEV